MEFPNSPYGVAQNLIQDFRSGHRNYHEFQQNLDTFESFLQQWSQGVQNLPEDPNFAPAVEVKFATLDSLDLYFEALTHLRSYAETRDEESARQALLLAREAHQLMLNTHRQAQNEVDRIENEMG